MDGNNNTEAIRISIIVPIYNVEEYLSECLDSVSALASKVSTEVLLIDNGSTDKSASIAESYCAGNECFTYYRTENNGVSAARNYGLDRARGDYIQFVDADDVILPEVFEEMLAIADKTGADAVRCGFERYKNGSVKKSGLSRRITCGLGSSVISISDDPCLIYDTVCWNKLVKRSLYLDHDIRFPEGVIYNEDEPVAARIYTNAGKCAACFKVGYLWRLRSGGTRSVTQRQDELQILHDKYDMIRDTVEYYRAAGNELAARKTIWKSLAFVLPQFADFPEDSVTERIQYLERYIDDHCDDGIKSELPAANRQIISDIKRRKPNHLKRLMNYMESAYKSAPFVYDANGHISFRLPEDLFDADEYPAVNELTDNPPAISVRGCDFLDDKLILRGHIVQRRVQTSQAHPQTVEAFLADSHDETMIRLCAESLPSEYLTEEYGSVICYEDYVRYSYDHDMGGFEITIDVGAVDEHEPDEEKRDLAILVKFSNVLNEGTLSLAGATAEVKKILKKWKYSGENSDISVLFDRGGNIFIRRQKKPEPPAEKPDSDKTDTAVKKKKAASREVFHLPVGSRYFISLRRREKQ
ncbi:MAG: glycosyltransferase family 2 protein [Mogibacterium sp.]|nr:glycosyltransferase family 2 protein [Mogibacterium sp.]